MATSASEMAGQAPRGSSYVPARMRLSVAGVLAAAKGRVPVQSQ